MQENMPLSPSERIKNVKEKIAELVLPEGEGPVASSMEEKMNNLGEAISSVAKIEALLRFAEENPNGDSLTDEIIDNLEKAISVAKGEDKTRLLSWVNSDLDDLYEKVAGRLQESDQEWGTDSFDAIMKG